MDETNPVYENFRNKMSTFGQPIRGTTRRVSASKFLGRDDLATQVEINARKITILKNVIQAQQIQTGVMLASLSTPTEGIEKSVMDIKETMSSILATLVAQEKFEMKQFLDMQRRTENLRRREREDSLETDSKGMKIIKSSVNKVLNPVKGIFQRIFSFFFTILAGRFLIKLLNFFGNPRNIGVVNAIGNFISGNFPIILGGVVAAGLGLLTLSGALSTAISILRGLQLATGLGPSLTGAGTGFVQRAGGAGAIKAPLAKGKLGANIFKLFLRRRTGGIVPGSGSNDTVPAMLTPGEVVISKPAAQKFGISNLLAINAAAGAKSIPQVKNNILYAGDGMVTPPPALSNILDLIRATGDTLPTSPLGRALSNPDNKNALQGVAESFAMPKAQQKNMGRNIMNTVANTLGGKVDTSKFEGVMKEFPNLTPPNIVDKIKQKKGFEKIGNFIDQLSNPSQIDPEGFDNSLDDISFNQIPKEKWLTYGAVI
tara:strand:+ start:1 stop:1458 length:1458 start_codon:yes stop_codon:yes gene_type:complete